MIIGVPKEIKEQEHRVALTPLGAKILIGAGHRVIIETKAGQGSGFLDKDYKGAGAEIKNTRQKIWKAQLIIKVKEPQRSEYQFLKPGQILFTYLHLAALPGLTKILKEKMVTAIDYATVEKKKGGLPLLQPMSEIAGKLAPQIGAHFLEKQAGGLGVLLAGAAGAEPVNVLILGGGTVGFNAAKIALGMGANVKVLEKKRDRCRILKKNFKTFKNRFSCLPCSKENLRKFIKDSNMLIGGILVAGAKAPKIVTEKLVKTMKPGSIIIDVSMDQGGCVETSRPTTHKKPIFIKHGIIHYCVTNMPGIVPKTSTLALTRATLPYVLELANKGFEGAVKGNSALSKGVNVYKGKITHPKLAEAPSENYTPLDRLLQ